MLTNKTDDLASTLQTRSEPERYGADPLHVDGACRGP